MPEPSPDVRPGHLMCPYCGSALVDRLYLGGVHVDSCECRECSARWDEDQATGEFLGRIDRSSARSVRERPRPGR